MIHFGYSTFCRATIYRMAKFRVRGEFDTVVWNAFTAVWRDNRSPRDVARAMGKDTAWVYKAKFRVLQRLKQEVNRLCDDLPIAQD